MKRSFLKREICLFLSVVLCFSFASCGKHKVKEYTIQISEEGKKERDAMLESGRSAYFEEEWFPYLWEAIIQCESQPVPTVQTKNAMDVYSYQNQDVYTLSDGDYEAIVLYIHGGAWVYQIDAAHFGFCDDLVDTLQAKVYIPIYDLAPNATYRETIAFVKAIYQDLQSQGKPIYVMGDSAGGTISLDLMYALKQERIPMPDRLVLLSPCCDLTFSNPEMEVAELADPMLAVYGCREFAILWADGEENLTNPAVSALYADVSDYPKTMLFQGTDDILCTDNYKLCEKFCESGVDVSLVKGEGLFHTFPLYDIPEKAESLNLIRDFCK